MSCKRYIIVTKDYSRFYTKGKMMMPMSDFYKYNPMQYRSEGIALAAMNSVGFDPDRYMVVPVVVSIELPQE